jgi:phosphatidylserine decarboxylase
LRISKEGTATILIVNVITISALISFSVIQELWLLAVIVPLLLIEMLIVYFFRDPERKIPQDENTIVSPADGKVVLIQDVHEDRFLKSDATQVSIFLSVFNVHVNRFPFSGVIKYYQYVQGRFLVAFSPEASIKNEQTVIGIETGKYKILFKQIAGLLARRIVFTGKENDQVIKGDRCGIIKFGSRVDIMVQKNVEIKVKVGDHVVGGESVIGIIK